MSAQINKLRLGSMILLSITMLLFLIFSSAYIFRAPLAKWVIAGFLPAGAKVTCIDFSIGFSPTLSIRKLCLNTDSVAVKIYNADWFIDNWHTKANRLSVDKLIFDHKKAGGKQIEAATALKLPDIVLPPSLPRLNINALTLQSYLLQKPLNVALAQSSPSTLTLSGDLDAAFDYINGELQGAVSWSPVQVFEQSPLLQQQTQFLQKNLNWDALVNTKIKSRFAVTGERIESVHNLSIKPQIRLENCSFSAKAKGTVGINLTLSNLEASIDASEFPITAELAECQLIPAQLKKQKTTKVQLIATRPVLLNASALLTTGVELRLPELQANPVITLSDITLGLEQTLSLSYTLEFATALEFASALADLQIDELDLNGNVVVNSTGTVTKNLNDWSIVSESANIQISEINSLWASAQSLTNSFAYQMSFSTAQKLELRMSGKQNITQLKAKSGSNSALTVPQIKTEWRIARSANDIWQITLKNDVPELRIPQTKLTGLANTSSIIITPDSKLRLTGQSSLQTITYLDKKLNKINVDHELSASLAKMETLGKHHVKLESGVNMQINHSKQDFTLRIDEQQISALQKLVSQFDSKIQLVAGVFSSEVSGSLSSNSYAGKLKVANASLKYDDFQILLLQMDEAFIINSAGIQLSGGKLKIDEINVGIPIRQVEMVVDVIDNVAKLELAKGELVGGTFTITDLWLDGRKQRTNLQVSKLDLAAIVALQKQQGIKVSGQMSGNFPFQIGDDDQIIEQGFLASDGPGKLKIQNNSAFDAIKEQQEQLSFLQNVEYRTLSSKVELASDGWLDLELSIAGRNPDKKQEVIFNYGHKENIFTLLKSLRISNSIQDSIEKRIEKRYSEKGK